MNKGISFVVLVCGLLCLSTAWNVWAAEAVETAPGRASHAAQALNAVQHAIDSGDVPLFQRHVDVDAIVAAAVDYFLRDAETPEGKARLSPVVAMIISSVGSSEDAQKTLRALVGREARNFVVYGVQSGNFAGTQRDNVPPPDGLLAPLFADASMGRKEIQNVGAPRVAGEDTLITFHVHDYGNGRSYPVTGRMRLVDKQWRLVHVENLPALAEKLRREAVE